MDRSGGEDLVRGRWRCFENKNAAMKRTERRGRRGVGRAEG